MGRPPGAWRTGDRGRGGARSSHDARCAVLQITGRGGGVERAHHLQRTGPVLADGSLEPDADVAGKEPAHGLTTSCEVLSVNTCRPGRLHPTGDRHRLLRGPGRRRDADRGNVHGGERGRSRRVARLRVGDRQAADREHGLVRRVNLEQDARALALDRGAARVTAEAGIGIDAERLRARDAQGVRQDRQVPAGLGGEVLPIPGAVEIHLSAVAQRRAGRARLEVPGDLEGAGGPVRDAAGVGDRDTRRRGRAQGGDLHGGLRATQGQGLTRRLAEQDHRRGRGPRRRGDPDAHGIHGLEHRVPRSRLADLHAVDRELGGVGRADLHHHATTESEETICPSGWKFRSLSDLNVFTALPVTVFGNGISVSHPVDAPSELPGRATTVVAQFSSGLSAWALLLAVPRMSSAPDAAGAMLPLNSTVMVPGSPPVHGHRPSGRFLPVR